MQSHLHSFANRMIDFDVYRNSKLIYTVPGLKNTENGTYKRLVEFFPETKIQIGDVLVNSGINYYITDVDTQTWMGQVSSIIAYYQTTPPQNNQTLSTVYNINSAQNSIIGNQQSAILNNSSFNIEDLKKLIELYGDKDKQQLYELTSLFKESIDKNDFHKGKLAKFGDLIAKHSWLPLALSQVLATWLQSH